MIKEFLLIKHYVPVRHSHVTLVTVQKYTHSQPHLVLTLLATVYLTVY